MTMMLYNNFVYFIQTYLLRLLNIKSRITTLFIYFLNLLMTKII